MRVISVCHTYLTLLGHSHNCTPPPLLRRLCGRRGTGLGAGRTFPPMPLADLSDDVNAAPRLRRVAVRHSRDVFWQDAPACERAASHVTRPRRVAKRRRIRLIAPHRVRDALDAVAPLALVSQNNLAAKPAGVVYRDRHEASVRRLRAAASDQHSRLLVAYGTFAGPVVRRYSVALDGDPRPTARAPRDATTVVAVHSQAFETKFRRRLTRRFAVAARQRG